ncbi:MAG TPA: hypothetical protein PKA82_12255 [Pyrinomonadaceae bacterium]|nr:hypothetical protein [Pyrinomonadaceae bacterium]
MKAIIRSATAALFAAILFAATASEARAQPEGGQVTEIYLAKDDGNGAEGERAENFELKDIPIYCIVKLNAPGGTNVKMILLAATVPGIKSGSKIVTTNYTLKAREDQVTFYGQPSDKWLAGKYRVELFLDNKLEKTIDFNIGDAEAAIKAAAKRPTPATKPATITKYKNSKP